MIRAFLLFLLIASPAAADLSYLGRYVWRDAEVCCLSGLEVSPDGQVFTALNDRGLFYQGRFQRKDGLIDKIVDARIAPVQLVKGGPTTGFNANAEGLTQLPDGRLFVSFEGFHRVRAYPTIKSKAGSLPAHPDFAGLQNNSSLEALADDAEGRLYTMPERSGRLDRPFPVYRYDRGRWSTPFSVPRRGAHLIVGADFGPDGRLYILERHFEFIGFSTRIRSFRLGANALEDEQMLLETPIGRHDNLEGISLWQDAQGRIRVTLVSDDNDNAFQRTEFVEYVLTD